MSGSGHHQHSHAFSAGGALVALGIIFGDIGTSPLYVFKAIVGEQIINKDLIFGAFSCVFWTLTLLTSIKYVWLALNADNKGEGGIFALFALQKEIEKRADSLDKSRPHTKMHKTIRRLVFPTLIGSSMLLADGFITPPISISSAVEGLKTIPFMEHIGIEEYILPIVLVILVLLFTVQQYGTHKIGSYFGPVMLVWFSMMAIIGGINLIPHPEILQAFNPYYAYNLVFHYKGGFWLLGAVFLCTTGAEAMYSDLGHAGKQNIRVSWGFIKVALLINYLGQAAWLLDKTGQKLTETPFYGMMPEQFRPFGVIIATFATIIASQALISGTFTLANEAMKLRLWPRMKVNYPSILKGQIYIPAMNWLLLFGCIFVVLYFKESSKMEAAYGLAITINMLMTSALLGFHLWATYKKDKIDFLGFIKKRYFVYITIALFVLIEFVFLFSNLGKIVHGGWFSLAIAFIFGWMMLSLFRTREIRKEYSSFEPMSKFSPVLKEISEDTGIPKEASHLVYLSLSENPNFIDKNIIYSITRKRPKRADIYWFLHIDVIDEPHGKNYMLDEIIPGVCYFVRIRFGYKEPYKANAMFQKVLMDLIKEGKLDNISNYESLKKYGISKDFKFILLNSRVSSDEIINPRDFMMIKSYRIIENMSASPSEFFGLETTNVEEELIPLEISQSRKVEVEDIQRQKSIHPYNPN
ncbi:MAG: KUP/HAK/KT family potassium transporter [Bacteroidia bacterium]|nr:KUP/HAK/KT family potassium transporter [Bacteroidia bacterium]